MTDMHGSSLQSSQGLQFPDRATLDGAVRAVRADADPTTWYAASA